jgi:hypothetical protein
LEVCNTAASLKGLKVHDVFVKTYDVRETIFSDQTGNYVRNSRKIPVEIPVPGHFPGFLVPESPESFF